MLGMLLAQQTSIHVCLAAFCFPPLKQAFDLQINLISSALDYLLSILLATTDFVVGTLVRHDIVAYSV